MSYLRLLASAFLILSLGPRAVAQAPSAEVIITPFIVDVDNADALRAQTERCFEQFAEALTARGVKVARDSNLSEQNLRSAPAPWAVLGRLSRREELFQMELRLLEVKTGEEMRSYFNSDKEPQLACQVVDKAAERIAAFVKEQRDSQAKP
jgi:hypothetical protein